MEVIRRPAAFGAYSGTFEATAAIDRRSAVLGSIDSALRGIGQVILINNPVTGIIFVLGICLHWPWAAVLTLSCALVSTLVATALRYDHESIRNGLYSFNGTLFGVLGAVFLLGEWAIHAVVISLFAAALSVPVMKITVEILVVKLEVPALTLTFALLGSLTLLLLPATANGRANLALLQPVTRSQAPTDPGLREQLTGTPVGLVEGLFHATFRGIGQVVLMDSVLVGVFIVLGIAAASRIGAVMAVLGSLAGALAGVGIGADGYSIYHGLWGYNGAVVAVGLFGVILEARRTTFVASVVAAAVSGLLYGALSQLMAPWGIVPLSFPLVLAILGTVFALKGLPDAIVPLGEHSTAETRLRRGRGGGAGRGAVEPTAR
ncbi:solute carrier family 14 (urea transporter) [Brevibacterium sanguinis]|uniref:Solute carrier family 14 (Urea transporter) n=2 Tax=Brevibacterium TaxID=1696 RepID=A0A366IFY4_9MICO|nr:solute carrier family 14 (urea transporter) [Brevibacterium sanguinis]RBP70271.1 solute carrier family 14 (urea transporter) [Brevibacterium celere]